MTDKRVSRRGAFGVLLLAAFALQTYHAGQQSLWYDEGFSVYLAAQSLSQITARTAADIHPPLYYYLLHAWQAGSGTTEFALRLLSAFFGVLCVPLAYVLGTRLFNRRAAFIAAALTAISPLYLWYGRDARMYTLVTALGMMASYFLLRLTTTTGYSRDRYWWAYVLTLTAAIYAHFYALFLLAFHIAYVLLDLPSHRPAQRRRALLRTGSAQLLVLIAFAPWSGFALTRLGADVSYWPGTLPLVQVVRDTLASFATGQTVPANIATPIAWGCLLLFAGALFVVAHSQSDEGKRAALFLALYFLTPLLLLFAISYGRPKWHPRYLMLASPPFLLALAGGATLLRTGFANRPAYRLWARGAAALAIFLVVATSTYADMNLYQDARFTKDDWRGVARYVSRHKQEDEVVILLSGHTFPVFTYYYQGDDWYPLPNEPTLSTRHVLGFDVATDLNRILAGKHGAWLVLWEDQVVDPNGIVPTMLATEGQETPVNPTFWGVGLRHFRFADTAHFSSAPPIQREAKANFGQALQLLGYRLPAQPSPVDGGAEITLFWQALHPLTGDYHLALRIRDAGGFLWGKLDRRPADYLYPTDRWAAGQAVPGHYRVPLLPGTPPGRYWLEVGVYAPAQPEGLDVLDAAGAARGKTFRLGPISLARPEHPVTPATLDLHNPQNLPVGDNLTLLGSELSGGPLLPGATVALTTIWQVRQPFETEPTWRLRWQGARGPAGPETVAPLGTGDFPVTRWQTGDVVRTQQALIVPREAEAGSLTLLGTLHDVTGRPLDSGVVLGVVQVKSVPHSFVPPAVAHAQQATFGEGIRLLGYADLPDVTHPGKSLDLTLHWQAAGSMSRSYTLFVHLLDAQGKVWGQSDRLPLDGARPTTSWLAGEFLTDTIAVPVKASAPAGSYRLEIGFYDGGAPDLPRLPAFDSSGRPVGDAVILDRPVAIR